MLEKLNKLEEKYEDLAQQLSDPDLINDYSQYQKVAKHHSELKDIVDLYREYKKVDNELADTEELIKTEDDPEFIEMAEMTLAELKEQKSKMENDLKVLLLPKDPKDEKNVIMEIRAGAGGSEAALFAGDLYRIYTRYAEKRGWRVEVMNTNYTDLDGIKEITFMIVGSGAYSKLKFESGVHRVQRIPETESGGRIHTSTATVAVLPEAEDVEIEINQNDIRIDLFCASGPGGQCVNTTQSAVRITHLPTGIVVSCQDEKSQLKNKDKALKVLKARLLDKAQQEQHDEIAGERKSQVGTGDRSERIRTYNYPQNRVTDHRIGLSSHRLEAILEGEIDEFIDALSAADQAEKLQNYQDE